MANSRAKVYTVTAREVDPTGHETDTYEYEVYELPDGRVVEPHPTDGDDLWPSLDALEPSGTAEIVDVADTGETTEITPAEIGEIDARLVHLWCADSLSTQAEREAYLAAETDEVNLAHAREAWVPQK